MEKLTAALPVLETPRLLLRPMTVQDAPDVVRWRNAPHVATMSRASTAELTMEEHLEWFEATRNERLDYIIIEKGSCQAIGSVSFTRLSLPQCERGAELGKYLGESSALGRGYGVEAAQRWLRFGFEILQLDCVIARTKETNAPNISVNERLGFKLARWPGSFGAPEQGMLFMLLDCQQWSEVHQSGKIS